MAEAAKKLTARCLCGGVSFALSNANGRVGACHCSMCQRWSGGPGLAVENAGPLADLKGGDLISSYASSDWIERGFCGRCGSSLYSKMRGEERYFVFAGVIAEQDALTLTDEIFIDDKPAYYAFANETNKMTGAEFVAAFSAGDQAGK